MFPRITHVIFDVDGLVVDTEGVFDTIIQVYARLMIGQEIPEAAFREMRTAMFGRLSEYSRGLLYEVLHGLDTSWQSPEDGSDQDYLVWRQPKLAKRFPNSELLPGVDRLIRHLAAHAVPMAIATSATSEDLDLKMTHHRKLLGLFDDKTITKGDVTNGKPDPESFIRAAGLMSVDKAELGSCLVFEDAPTGVEAAVRAGMPVVAVPHPMLDTSEVSGATQVLSSLEEFEPEKWGLPAFD